MAYIGASPSNGIRRKYKYTATAAQTSFTNDDNGITVSYVDSLYVDVFQNGVKLAQEDYTSTTGTSVVLVQAASADDIIEIIVFDVFGVADTVSQSAGGNFAGDIGMGGTLAVTGNTTVGGTLGVTGGIVSPVTINGTTPTLTIGDAGAEDAKIVFDGNAQDFHIGLDDSTDSLTIGLGSALGTTSHMVIDSTGAVTMPNQPAFYAHNNGTNPISDIAPNASRDVPFSSELFDNNGDFASNTFTAPVTGKYNLGVSLRLQDIDSAAAYYIVSIVISNLSAHFIFDPDYGQDNLYHSVRFSTLTHMDANDTAKVTVNQSGGTAQTDIQGDSSYTYFFGHLVC
jgi:hypothetical protein